MIVFFHHCFFFSLKTTKAWCEMTTSYLATSEKDLTIIWVPLCFKIVAVILLANIIIIKMEKK